MKIPKCRDSLYVVSMSEKLTDQNKSNQISAFTTHLHWVEVAWGKIINLAWSFGSRSWHGITVSKSLMKKLSGRYYGVKYVSYKNDRA